MAYRRRHGMQRATTFKEETHWRSPDDDGHGDSLAAQAIRASSAHRDSSLSSAYTNAAFHSSFKDRSKDAPAFDQTSPKSPKEAGGFWGVVARKAKAILENGNLPNNLEAYNAALSSSIDGEFYSTYQPAESSRKLDNPRLRKGLDALATSLNQIGDTIGNALEEGRTIVGSRTADFIQETRKLQNRRREMNSGDTNQASGTWQQNTSQVHMQASQEDQLKASRDVAMATAAKAKLLLRELKTVKADLAFAKQRCSQLEEENRILREARDKGDNPADDEMIRRQLETLLAEKSRLATENSLYARENRFLREVVEYHQLTMQDIVYLDEGIEEVAEVGVPRVLSTSPSLSSLQSPPPETSPSISRTSSKEILHLPELHKLTTTTTTTSTSTSAAAGDVSGSLPSTTKGPVLTDSQEAQSNSSATLILTLEDSTA